MCRSRHVRGNIGLLLGVLKPVSINPRSAVCMQVSSPFQ